MTSIEPVALTDFLATFWAGAGVIISGAGYALLYAWARLRRQWNLLYLAGFFFLLLTGCVLVLMQTAHLEGHWQALALLMLVGYLLAPPAIFRLCQVTHVHESTNLDHPPTREETHP